MEKKALQWLAGDVPFNPHKVIPRPFEEMSDKAEFSDDGRENGVNGVQDESSTTPCLPGCTRGKDHKEPWQMSIYHMQAYLSMRGCTGADEDDPMLKWIAEQDRKKEEKAAENGAEPAEPSVWKKYEPKGIFASAKDSIKMDFDWKTEGPAKFDDEDSDRATSFKYTRPKIEHLKVPDMLNPEYLEEMYQKHTEAGGGWSQFVNDYCSDDEDDPANGRISPCTYRRWTEGAKRWDAPGDKYKSVMEERKEFEIPDERQRPESPNTLEPRARKSRSKEAQVDERDGTTMSPICSEYAETEPSILWSPPPMTAHLPKAIQKDQLHRMDPELAIALREGHKDLVLGSADSFGVDETNPAALAAEIQNIHPAEINAVVDKYWNANETFDTIAQKQRDLHYLRQNEQLVNDTNERYRGASTALKHENRKLLDCLQQLRRNRDMRIMKHVDGQMRELEYEGKVKLAEIEAQYKENAQLRREYEHERSVQARLLAEFGKQTPEEVFDEMYPDVWQPLEKRKNYRNFSG